MPHRSTIYSHCPKCHKYGLVQPVQDTHRCAACNFDYRTLADDPAAREAWMLENLRDGPFMVVSVLFLHRQILALSPQESNAIVFQFAAKHGVELPTGKPMSAAKGVVLILGAILAMIALGATLNFFLS